ncbi:MAG: 16S rRNA processing protein RimM [Clostridia bacterium]|nr:16S rRNA processing protein RimM [Clostridia bacterium]
MEKYLECGEILRIHGLNGGLVVKHYCDSFEVFSSLKKVFLKQGNEYIKKKIEKISAYKGGALILLDGINDADKAMKLRGKLLYAERDDIALEDGDFFIADLIGLEVFDIDTNERYGVLKDVINCGAQDLYVVAREEKPDALIPVINEFVKEISLEKGIFVKPIEGMF